MNMNNSTEHAAVPTKAKEQAKTPARAPLPAAPGDRRGGRGPRGRGGGRGPRRGGRPERARSEYDQKMISIRRVARVVAGGRRFSFSVAMVLGDHKGKVGVGLGKGGDTALAIEKATRDAKKNMIKVRLTKDNSIAHGIHAKYAASQLHMIPVKGRGLVAGSSVRTVLDLAGITNISAKLLTRSKNPVNNAQVTMKALRSLKA